MPYSRKVKFASSFLLEGTGRVWTESAQRCSPSRACCLCRVMCDGAVGQLGSNILIWLRISDVRGIFLDVFSNSTIQILLILEKRFMHDEVQP